MKYSFVFLMLCINLGLTKLGAQTKFDAKQKSIELTRLFEQQKFGEIHAQMDAEMKRGISAEQMQEVWDGLLMQFDSLYSIDEPVVTEEDTFQYTVSKIHFKNTKIGLQLAFNQMGQISGFHIIPASYPYQPAVYVNATAFYEIKKNVPDSRFPSEGVLTIPNGKKKVPVIIIVGGSGPTDKDLTMGANKIYKDFAWGLAAKGIAVYRYSKRTLEFGQDLAKNKSFTVDDEYLSDLKQIAKMLSKNEAIDAGQIYIMGHSEGGYLLPYFAKNISGIKGYISLAGNYNKLAVLVPKQLTYLASQSKDPKEKERILAMMPKALYARDKLSKESPDDSLPLGLSTAYLCHLNEICPQKTGKYLMNKPSFFLQGGRDYQVPPEELELWKMTLAQSTQATYKIYPKLNHVFLSGKGLSVPDEYEKPGNVPEEVINDIASWVLH